MKIGLFIDNIGHRDVDLNEIHLGNPGIGGSEYQSYILAYFLVEFYSDIECVIFTPFEIKLKKKNISNFKVSNVVNAVSLSKEAGIDILIINKHSNFGICDLGDLCNLIDKLKVKTITVGHNFYSQKECDLISRSEYIVRNVYVSRQQFYLYYNHSITKKSTYIYAFMPFEDTSIRNLNIGKNVTYTGSLTSTKGFHVLARNWKNVLKKCPDANLFVVGSGKLYSREAKLGKYNIAEESYEKLFINYLLDDKGKILDSVKFLGLLTRDEIKEVYKNTLVGVVNPSGISECCPISSIEYQALGIPVVSKRYGGLIDTIKHYKTGLLFRSEFIFVRYIVKLLTDYKLNKEFGVNGYNFSRNFFSEK